MSAGCVLVTGGSRGIGRAIVLALVAEDRTVAFTWRRDADAAREVELSSGGRAHAFQLDVAQRARPAEIVAQVEATIGPVEGLVNNAGQRHAALLVMTSDAAWDEIVDVNLGGAFRCCRAVLPGMLHRRSGSIVNVASLVAIAGLPGEAAHAASKAGLLGMTRSLAREVGKRGVRANAVLPGFVETDMTSGLRPEIRSFLQSVQCLPGGTTPQDVAGAVTFLLSDKARAITGQSIVVDAGSSA